MKKLFLIIALVVALPAGLAAQAIANNITHTPLSANITSQANPISFAVGSATGFTANTTMLVVNKEAMLVTGVSGTTITAQRGYNGTVAMQHNSGDVVFVGALNNFYTSPPNGGRCTAASQRVLPYIAIDRTDGNKVKIWNCNNSFWEEQQLPNSTTTWRPRYCTAGDLGSLTLLRTFAASAFDYGTSTTPVAGTIYYSTVFLPRTMRITGISSANGTVAGTDNLIYVLYRADGTPLAQTAAAGTTASGIDDFQDIAFTTPFVATGPARYWIGVSASGTTTRLRTMSATQTAAQSAYTGVFGSSALGTFNIIGTANLIGGVGETFTTALPTSLVADTAPIACVY